MVENSILEKAAARAQARDFAQAETLVRSVLSRSPGDLQALYLLGVVLAGLEDHESAMTAFEQVLRHYRVSAEVWAHCAASQAKLGRLADTVASYDMALALSPAHSDWWHLRGAALVSLCRFEAALDSFDRALAIDAGREQTISARGVALEGLGRTQEAAECYRQALAVAPEYATAHSNLGRLQREFGDLAAALESLRRAVALRPDFAMAHHNLGSALYDLGDLTASIASYRTALGLAPDFAECEYSLAVALLKSRQFEAGWKAFEARLRFTRHTVLEPPRGLAQWDGGALGARTLVLVAEAGSGDVIQFTRYAAQLNDRGIRPLLLVEPRMAALLATSGYFAGIFEPGTELEPSRHVWCSLMTLPLRLLTVSGRIPEPRAYLKADGRLVNHWRMRLQQLTGMRVGLVWQGNPAAETGSLRGRSMPLQALEPLCTLAGVSLISLQKGPAQMHLQAVSFGARIKDWGGELDLGPDAFVDTAAVLMNLDLVITTDTSMAHLAGALGVPVWVALHCTSDWRWFQADERSPWYPTMTLFRQHGPGEWATVIESMRIRLQSMLAT